MKLTMTILVSPFITLKVEKLGSKVCSAFFSLTRAVLFLFPVYLTRYDDNAVVG